MFNYIEKIFNFFRYTRQSKAIDSSILKRRMKEKSNEKENKILAAKIKRQEKIIKNKIKYTMQRKTTTTKVAVSYFDIEKIEHDNRLLLANVHRENKSLFYIVTCAYLYKNLHVLIEYKVLKSSNKITKTLYAIDEMHTTYNSLDEVIELINELSEI